jgi:hypothetical protein
METRKRTEREPARTQQNQCFNPLLESQEETEYTTS